MTSSTHGQCALCGAENSYSLQICHSCSARLPWASPAHQAPSPGHVPPQHVPPAYGNPQPPALAEDSTGALVGFGCGSVLLPCIGFILGICFIAKYPRRAFACFIGAIIGFILGFFLLFVEISEEASRVQPAAPPPGYEPLQR